MSSPLSRYHWVTKTLNLYFARSIHESNFIYTIISRFLNNFLQILAITKRFHWRKCFFIFEISYVESLLLIIYNNLIYLFRLFLRLGYTKWNIVRSCIGRWRQRRRILSLLIILTPSRKIHRCCRKLWECSAWYDIHPFYLRHRGFRFQRWHRRQKFPTLGGWS